jgi:hypothetical protein
MHARSTSILLMLDAKLPYLVEPASCRGINAIFKCVNSLDSLTAETDLIDTVMFKVLQQYSVDISCNCCVYDLLKYHFTV